MYMQTGLQAHIAFHLSGMRPGAELDSIDGLGLRPALLAGYRDLAALRYDFPLVLVAGAEGEAAVVSLSGLIDDACREIAVGAGSEQMRKLAHRFERELRATVAERGSGLLSALWDETARRLSADADENLARLRAAITVDGEVVDCDRAMPFRLCHHAWKVVHAEKSRRFRDDIGRLALKLADILRADFVHSPEGLSAEKLKASVGTTQRDVFDFDALSQLLTKTSSRASLSDSRRRRILWLLNVLETQRFYPPTAADDEHQPPYGFVYEACADAVAAYRERLPKMVELTQAIAMARLEVEGEYCEARHDPFFANFGVDNLDPRNFNLFPDYLILVHAADMRAADTETILEAFAGGMRAKVLVQTDDLLEPSAIMGGSPSFGLRSRQLASTAIGLSGFYVLQSAASNLLQFRSRIFGALTYPGPALFSVYSGASGNGLPPYLNAAAAMESRVFPAFTYDPSAGPDWATRFDISANPQADRAWPAYTLAYEDEGHQRIVEDTAFTLADFVACDGRYARHFARVPREKWNGGFAPVAEYLDGQPGGIAEKVPCLLMVDADNVLQKVIVDDRLLREGRRAAEMWRSLQELGGIHSSHVARERKAWEEQRQASAAPLTNGHAAPCVTQDDAPEAAAMAEVEAEPERSPEDAYIETARCSSCNECTLLNDKMFAYDANKQAYIKDAGAGTYAQLVEAAENCQLSIIHPGQPRNPEEPGIDELLKRAEPFL